MRKFGRELVSTGQPGRRSSLKSRMSRHLHIAMSVEFEVTLHVFTACNRHVGGLRDDRFLLNQVTIEPSSMTSPRRRRPNAIRRESRLYRA